MRKKVLHLINSLSTGGAETLITDYALKIDKEAFEMIIVVISPSKATINEERLKKAGIRVIHLGNTQPYSNEVNIIKRMINKICRHKRFQKIVEREKPNIIHTHLHTNNYVVPISTKKQRIKLFYTIHHEISENLEKTRRIIPSKFCVKYKGMIPITLHAKMQKEANDFFETNSSIVIPNAIDVKRFENNELNKVKKLHSLNINESVFVVGHVGRFVEQKNHKFLIDVFATVKRNRKDAHLILIGIGELEDKIQAQVNSLGLQNSISFLGNREDVPDLMRMMDVFVFPSLHEGFGNVLIEAQAAGVKCIASDTIPKDAFVTNLVTPLSLNDTIEIWADTIVNGKKPDEIKGDLYKHDINNVIKKLESIYLDSTGE